MWFKKYFPIFTLLLCAIFARTNALQCYQCNTRDRITKKCVPESSKIIECKKNQVCGFGRKSLENSQGWLNDCDEIKHCLQDGNCKYCERDLCNGLPPKPSKAEEMIIPEVNEGIDKINFKNLYKSLVQDLEPEAHPVQKMTKEKVISEDKDEQKRPVLSMKTHPIKKENEEKVLVESSNGGRWPKPLSLLKLMNKKDSTKVKMMDSNVQKIPKKKYKSEKSKVLANLETQKLNDSEKNKTEEKRVNLDEKDKEEKTRITEEKLLKEEPQAKANENIEKSENQKTKDLPRDEAQETPEQIKEDAEKKETEEAEITKFKNETTEIQKNVQEHPDQVETQIADKKETKNHKLEPLEKNIEEKSSKKENQNSENKDEKLKKLKSETNEESKEVLSLNKTRLSQNQNEPSKVLKAESESKEDDEKEENSSDEDKSTETQSQVDQTEKETPYTVLTRKDLVKEDKNSSPKNQENEPNSPPVVSSNTTSTSDEEISEELDEYYEDLEAQAAEIIEEEVPFEIHSTNIDQLLSNNEISVRSNSRILDVLQNTTEANEATEANLNDCPGNELSPCFNEQSLPTVIENTNNKNHTFFPFYLIPYFPGKDDCDC